MPSPRLALICIWLIVLPLGSEVAAQTTMRQWEDDILLMLRGRDGSVGGMLYDRGIQRRYTPRMDHEYALDVRGARFSPEEDASFYGSASGIRSYAASIDKSHFATITDVRHEVPLGSRVELAFRGRQQDDLRSQRFFVEGGAAFNIANYHYVGFSQTMAAFKPDLDTEIFYETRDPVVGRLHAGIVFLDAYNNFIIDGLGVDPTLQDTLRSYESAPRLIRSRWISPSFGRVSMEAYIGFQPEARAHITTQSDPSLKMNLKERFGYGLVTVGVNFGRVYGSAYIGAWREQTSFQSEPSSSFAADYAVSQRETWYGIRVRGDTPAPRNRMFVFVIDAALNRYRDHQTGEDFSGASVSEAYHLKEDRLELEARVGWYPEQSGWRAGLRWLSDHRKYNDAIDLLERDFLKFAQWTPNSRISLILGYEYRKSFRIDVGASFDVDGDDFYTDGRGLTRFDGGFGRVQLLW